MFHLLRNLVATGTVFVSLVVAQGDPKLTGTWSTKSHKVFTGPVRFTFVLVARAVV